MIREFLKEEKIQEQPHKKKKNQLSTPPTRVKENCRICTERSTERSGTSKTHLAT